MPATMPAPWVTYTRAGCDFGAAGTANTILENVTTDIDTVFGPDSEEKREAQQDPQQATRDFVGVGVHCARTHGSVCDGAPHARPDVLPDEPGGYEGYRMIQGHRYVAEKVPITAADGTPIAGFPGFDGMVPNVTLGYVASMLEGGVPVVYGYLSDAHDNHTTGQGPFGPGEAGYVQQLREYDEGFARFFERLRHDGIDASNTLFTVTVDEGDHPDVKDPQPAHCDGVHQPCTYGLKGEVSANLRGLIATQTGVDTLFTVHSDSSPTVYIEGNPDQLSDTTRALERATMMALLGLEDGYVDEGRVLYEDLEGSVVPPNVRAQRDLVLAFQRTLKQLDAPIGQFGVASLAGARLRLPCSCHRRSPTTPRRPSPAGRPRPALQMQLDCRGAAGSPSHSPPVSNRPVGSLAGRLGPAPPDHESIKLRDPEQGTALFWSIV